MDVDPVLGVPADEAPAPTAWPRSRVTAVTAWATLTLAWVAVVGIPTDRALISLWLAAGLAALSAGSPRWYRPLLDWSPFIVFFVAYQNVRGLAYSLDLPTVWQLPITVDTWLGGGVLPTEWLQQHLMPAGGQIAWWEVPLGIVYMSHFYASFLLAAILWKRDRALFTSFIRRLMVVLGVTVVVYVAMPTAPPWAAARCSAAQVSAHPASPACMDQEPDPGQRTLLGPVRPPNPGDPDHLQRVTTRGFSKVPGASKFIAGAIGVGIEMANPVAAVPSLHSACAALIAVFLWPRVRRRWRPLLAAYPLLMGFTLVWGADHYVFDVLAGWLLVAVVTVGARVLGRRRA